MILQHVSDVARERWTDWMPGETTPPAIRYLGIPGSVEGGTTTFLALAPKRRRPLFAVKIHRHPGARDRALGESQVLSRIAALGPAVAGTVPRMLCCREIGGTWILIQSIVAGGPMGAPMSTAGIPALATASANFDAASEWLIRLRTAQGTSAETPGAADESSDRIAEFAERFPLTDAERAFVRELLAALPALGAMDRGIQHGDFCRQNLLCHEQGLNVIDWTDSRCDGHPLFDFCYFLTSYCLQVRKGIGIAGFVRMFEATFFERNAYQTIVAERLRAHARRSGIDAAAMPLLFAWFLVEQAMREYRKQRAFAQNGVLSRFTLYLASVNGRTYAEALTEHLWIYFFRFFAAHRHRFLA